MQTVLMLIYRIGMSPNVEIMAQLFKHTIAFNQDLNSWDMSSVTNMSFMSQDARSFNGNIADLEYF